MLFHVYMLRVRELHGLWVFIVSKSELRHETPDWTGYYQARIEGLLGAAFSFCLEKRFLCDRSYRKQTPPKMVSSLSTCVDRNVGAFSSYTFQPLSCNFFITASNAR